MISLIGSTAEINDFDATFVWFAEKNVFRFHVAMDYVVLLHEVEGDQELDGETSD